MSGIQEWWSQGEQVELCGHRIWMRRWGSGPSLTLLHGFPSSSHDFAKIAPALEAEHELITLDLLGFGASDKPADHDYSIFEQVDIVDALWAHHGITASAAVVHDYSVTVAQELLARNAPLDRVVFMNGGLYPDIHRPVPTQEALADPELGPQLSANMTGDLFAPALRETFNPDHAEADADARDIWAS